MCNLLTDKRAHRLEYLTIEKENFQPYPQNKHMIPYPTWLHRDERYQNNKVASLAQEDRDIFVSLAGSRKAYLRSILIVSV